MVIEAVFLLEEDSNDSMQIIFAIKRNMVDNYFILLWLPHNNEVLLKGHKI